MTLPATAVAITGTAQHDAWQRRVLPPVEEVRPGLWSVPVPIPHNPLRYTLSYVFLGATAVVVDPGWDTATGRDALARGLAVAGAALTDVAGIVVTHVHPDHHGLSGWLRETSGAWIAMHPAEAATLPARVWHHENATDHDIAWLTGYGVPDAEAPPLAIEPGDLTGMLAMAEPDRYIADGDLLPVPGRDVRAVWTPGHTPGHLCLHDAAAGVLLTGDHLLPRISPNIGIHSDRNTDALTRYVASLDRAAGFGDDEALPAHEYRFRGIGARAAELTAHHRDRCDEILDVAGRLRKPTAWAIATGLTWSRGWDALHGMMRRMALAETIAHLHHLVATGELAPTSPVSGGPALWRPVRRA